MNNIQVKEDAPHYIQYLKKHPKVQLDFSAIAKGYGVDVIAEFLEHTKTSRTISLKSEAN